MLKRTLFIVILFFVSIPFLTGCVTAVVAGAAVSADMASDRRSSGTYIDDQSIEIQVSDLIGSDETLSNSSSISVVSFNRVVLLVGQAPSGELKDRASAIVRTLNQVTSVHNEIRISTPGSFLSTTNDTWLTTKAKSLMLAEKDFSSHHIKVYSENGEIFLMGLVTKAEAEKAIAIVRNIDGVERVVQLFEYIQ
ncbi:MAG: BON domain-containing protein [Gammaproteobacteria bacterium]|nr:BON domain-containing protein [Gammaproteobacteria bacterium]